MRVAAIDCGTNSIRLLVADLESPGGSAAGPTVLRDVVRRMEIARLGEDVDRTGVLAPQALARTFAVIEDYAAQCEALGVERVRIVATSATRDAANRMDFVEGVRARMGVAPEVLSGDEEARLSFMGAAGGAIATRKGPTLVVDIGGGSTELVLGDAGVVLAQRSMDVGSVRMRERHLHTDPPTAAELASARADVDRHLDEAGAVVDFAAVRTVVGVAGTITSVTAEVLGLNAYDPVRIDGAQLPIESHLRACEWFLSMPAAERATHGHLHPGRVDIIGAGGLVWQQILRRFDPNVVGLVVTSEHDILDGAALSLGG